MRCGGWTGPRSADRWGDRSQHCDGLFLAQPAEQEFGSPSQNLFASVSARQGEGQQQDPARVQERPDASFGTCSPWLQLLFGAHRVPVLCSALQGQCHPLLGTVSPPLGDSVILPAPSQSLEL